MNDDRWCATEKRLAEDIRKAAARELDPVKRPRRTPHDFARIRNFLMNLLEDAVHQQPDRSAAAMSMDESEFLRQKFSSFMTKNFSDPGMQFCPVRLNFCSTRNEQRKRQRERESEAQLVEEAKQRRIAEQREIERQARLADWYAVQERLKKRGKLSSNS